MALLMCCVGPFGCGGGSSSSGSGISKVAPSITTQPASQTVVTGAAASFTVTATGPNLTYQWYKAAAALSGATSATYSIAAAASSDASAYYVIVSNANGSVQSTTVTLTVNSGTTGGGTGNGNVIVQ